MPVDPHRATVLQESAQVRQRTAPSPTNSINLTGRLTRDPEARATRDDTTVAELRLAVQRRRGRGGDDRGAVYVDVVAFGGLADSIVEYLAKGRQVAVSGRLDHSQWKAEDGISRSRHKVIANEIDFVGPKPGGDPEGAA